MRRIRKKETPQHLTDWIDKFRMNCGAEPSYEDLAKSEEYGKLKRDLLIEQGYICCYCEKEVGVRDRDGSNIEHFMPRHPDQRILTPAECAICKNAQLDYTNMFVSCGGDEQYSSDHCNHKKDNWFDFNYCISPVSEKIEGLFGFRLNGKIFAVNNNICAEQMKQSLNLDSYVLQKQREKAYDTVLEEEFPDDTLLQDDEYINETIKMYQEKDENGRYEPFCSMITYCLREYLL